MSTITIRTDKSLMGSLVLGLVIGLISSAAFVGMIYFLIKSI